MKRLAAIAALLLLFAVAPAPSGATSTTNDENQLLTLINDARADNGLEPLRINTRLWDIAGTRAGRLASKNVLSHTAAGNLRSEIGAKHVPYYGFGEAIGFTPVKRGAAAVADLFRMWKDSPEHWALMMSANYNYVGIGLSYRSSNHRTFGSIVFTESRDLTGGRAEVVSANLSGNDVVWTWEGWDPRLQTHTAGLEDFDVQSRIDGGRWGNVFKSTSQTSWTRVPLRGHWYGLQVRARDRLGNVGPWSSEMRLWVP